MNNKSNVQELKGLLDKEKPSFEKILYIQTSKI